MYEFLVACRTDMDGQYIIETARVQVHTPVKSRLICVSRAPSATAIAARNNVGLNNKHRELPAEASRSNRRESYVYNNVVSWGGMQEYVANNDSSSDGDVLTPYAVHTAAGFDDGDIEALRQATKAFEDDYKDGECLCFSGNMNRPIYPGENFYSGGTNQEQSTEDEQLTA